MKQKGGQNSIFEDFLSFTVIDDQRGGKNKSLSVKVILQIDIKIFIDVSFLSPHLVLTLLPIFGYEAQKF
jgi:hypothetical protein